MSAVVAAFQPAFVTETGVRSSSVGGAFLTETVTTGVTVDLASNLAPGITFTGDLTTTSISYVDLASDLAPGITLVADVADLFNLQGDFASSIALGADLTVDAPAARYVDLAGKIGGQSLYGRGRYGLGPYSRGGAIAPTFVGELQGIDRFLEGSLTPQIDLQGLLGLDQLIQGELAFTVTFEASLIAGPLWVRAGPGAPPWSPSEPCPPSLWTPTEPHAPVDWEESELCNG